MNAEALESALESCRQDSRHRGVRALCVVNSRSSEDCVGIENIVLPAIFSKASAQTTLWIGNGRYLRPPVVSPAEAKARAPAVNASRYREYLGTELDLLVFDGYSGLPLNAMSALSGCLRAGGLMVLLMPPLQDRDWSDPECERLFTHPYQSAQSRDLFTQWFRSALEARPGVLQVTAEGAASQLLSSVRAAETPPAVSLQRARLEQQSVLKHWLHEAEKSRCCLLVTADRGRGKSTLLGQFAGQLIRRTDTRQVLVCSHHPSAVTILFRAAANASDSLLPVGRQERLHHLELPDGLIRFRAAPELMQTDPEQTWLLIDEAAALPGPTLDALLLRFPRVVMATTLHGYEGSGQGFRLRFLPRVITQRPELRQAHLQTPVRWSDEDTLEQFLNRSLLLQEEAAPSRLNVSAGAFEISPQRLLEAENMLTQVFSLLSLAHYRTEPDDLRLILDSPTVRLWVCVRDGQLCGALMANHEPAVRDEGLQQDIRAARRRPRGLLSAMTLAQQVGLHEAMTLDILRIVRVVVHPEHRRQGIASELVSCVLSAAQNRQDAVTTSYALNPGLGQFWNRNHFEVLRIGQRPDRYAGTHSVLSGTALTPAARALWSQAQHRLRQRLPFDCLHHLSDLPDDLFQELLVLQGRTKRRQDLPALLEAFADGNLPYHAVEDLLPLWAAEQLDWSRLDATSRSVWLRKVLLQKPWKGPFTGLVNPGKSTICQLLRDTLNTF